MAHDNDAAQLSAAAAIVDFPPASSDGVHASSAWSVTDILLLVQTIYKCGFIEWNSIAKKLRNNPQFQGGENEAAEFSKQCEIEFNRSFKKFTEKTEFFTSETTDLHSCLQAFAAYLVNERIKIIEENLECEEREILHVIHEIQNANTAIDSLMQFFDDLVEKCPELKEFGCKNASDSFGDDCESDASLLKEPFCIDNIKQMIVSGDIRSSNELFLSLQRLLSNEMVLKASPHVDDGVAQRINELYDSLSEYFRINLL